MNYFRQHRRIIGFIASLAVLLSSLMPTMTHAMANKQDKADLVSQICSVSGIKFIAFDSQAKGNQQPQNQKSKPLPMSIEHCPYCLTHAGSVGLIFKNQLVITQFDLSYSFPKLFYQFPYPLFAWVSSSPRAPPSIS